MHFELENELVNSQLITFQEAIKKTAQSISDVDKLIDWTAKNGFNRRGRKDKTESN